MPVVMLVIEDADAARWALEHPDEVAGWAAARAAEELAGRVDAATRWQASLTCEDDAALADFEAAGDADWADNDGAVGRLDEKTRLKAFDGIE
ncbi:hypothetical protein AB0J83_31015 [Actinoplanes sp. NPDC049596]|uniref:hypothetical protein n=1 Tax=unclassified Actinoplanes TaxID=2626549 RepID=UPI003448FA97